MTGITTDVLETTTHRKKSQKHTLSGAAYRDVTGPDFTLFMEPQFSYHCNGDTAGKYLLPRVVGKGLPSGELRAACLLRPHGGALPPATHFRARVRLPRGEERSLRRSTGRQAAGGSARTGWPQL